MSATVGGTTTLVASASDNVKVSRVVFYRSTTPIGVATLSGPATYSLNWSTTALPNGCYVLYAQAYDSAGNVSQSSGVVVMVTFRNDGVLKALQASRQPGGVRARAAEKSGAPF